MPGDKKIDGWLVVDWKQESLKARKTKPTVGELGTNELMAKVSVDVSVPDVDIPTLALEIDVPEPKVYAATIEALDDDDLPDWSGVANEKVEANRKALEHANNSTEWKGAVDETTVDVLREFSGRPDVENVREYIVSFAHEMVEHDGVDE